jgi:hypothetical protein
MRITDERRYISAETHFMNRTVGYILCPVKEMMRELQISHKRREK